MSENRDHIRCFARYNKVAPSRSFFFSSPSCSLLGHSLIFTEEEEEEDGFGGRRLGVLATEAARQKPSRTSRCAHDCRSADGGVDKFQKRELSVGADTDESSCGGPRCYCCPYGWHRLLLWRKSLEITLES
ncbi:HIG1 domain-containing protein [Psidium guajava]|nr:HIG1 domain-containing protein [Psidium guajava]